MKTCIACGMPMLSKSDYFYEDESKDYCIYCTKSDGSMCSYDEKLESMSNLIVRTQGIDKNIATSIAKLLLDRLPAWKK